MAERTQDGFPNPTPGSFPTPHDPATVNPGNFDVGQPPPKPNATGPLNLNINPEDFDVNSPKISRERAAEVLKKRFPVGLKPWKYMRGTTSQSGEQYSTDDYSRDIAALTDTLARLLPEDLLTEDAIQNFDMRAALQQVMLAPAQTSKTNGGEVNGIPMRDTERHLAALALVDLTEKYSKEWPDLAVSRITANGEVSQTTEDAIDVAEHYLYSYRDGDVVRVPTDKEEGNYYLDAEGKTVYSGTDAISRDVASAANGDFDPTSDGSAVEGTPTKWLRNQDLQRMLAGNELTIEDIRQIEQADLAMDPSATDPNNPRYIRTDAKVQYTNETRDVERSGPWDPTIAHEKDWYSVNEVLGLPGTFSPEERVLMVQRMEKAGFLAKGAVVGGDTTSADFKSAWATLAQSALEQGKSIVDVLEEREKAYQETIMDSFSTRLTDPARLRISGNNIGKSLIGRKLTDEENAKMVEFVHNLERENAKINAGLNVTEGAEIAGVDALDEGIQADIDARMNEWVRDENGVEAGAHDISNQYEQFTRMLGGPGRGVS
jgi:hypothetical protein